MPADRRSGALVLAFLIGGCAGGAGGAGGTHPGLGGLPAGDGSPAAEATFRLDDPLEREVSPFEVVGQDGNPYAFPFLGGFDVPRPQFVDLDGDGDLDLFLQAYRGELLFFENTGTPTAPRFEWRTSHFQDLDVGEWVRFHDMDGDGRPDLFMEMPSSYIRYARNVGTQAEARFEVSVDSVKTPEGRAIFSDAQNIPSLVDIDCNGRPDLFLGRIDGTLARYEFTEFRGGQPVFALVTERFENIEIIGVFGVPGGPLPDPSPPGTLHQPTLHGANSMAFGDWNGDGAPDLFWGDFFEPGLLLIRNIGTCPRPNFDVEPVPVPASPPISTSGYNAPALADLDGDGHMDLLVGVLGGAFNPNRTSTDNLLFYRGQPDGTFELETTRFLNGLDIGSEAVPAFGDLTGNGAPDLLVGSKLDPATSRPPPLHWYENVGTRTAPRFEFRATLPEVAHLNGAPVLADLDGDGLLDLLVGTFNENIRFYRNVGTAQAPRFEEPGEGPIARIPRGSYTAPAVGDLTGNGLLDLVVGQSSGALSLFLNTGTPAEPRFELVPEVLDGINVGSRSSPLLVDVDGNGTLDLLVGEETGQLLVFENQGTPTEPRFGSAGRPFPGHLLSDRLPRLPAPRLVDLDGNGTLDLVMGNQGGGLVFFRNRGARPEPMEPWPGPAEVETVDAGGVFEENLSGLAYEAATDGPGPGTLWAVRNGPSNLFRLNWDHDSARWNVGADGTWTLRYPDGSGVPDAEGVTRVPSGPWAGLYVATERDNEVRDVSRNRILRFDPAAAAAGGTLVATHAWDLTGTLPPTGPNRGIEAIAWIPDTFLVQAGFMDPRTGARYTPASGAGGADRFGGGLFVVGVEETGRLHLVALDHRTGEHAQVAEVDTGLGAVMGLVHDAELGNLWAACDNVCDGRIAVLRIGPDGHFQVDRVLRRPAGMANLNNEGIVLAPLAECRGGVRPFYWTDDDETDGHSLRRGAVACP